jgi:hypothetical protein
MKKILVNPPLICTIFFIAQSSVASNSIRPMAMSSDSSNIYSIITDMNSVNKKSKLTAKRLKDEPKKL